MSKLLKVYTVIVWTLCAFFLVGCDAYLNVCAGKTPDTYHCSYADDTACQIDLMEAIYKAFEPFNVTFVTERPIASIKDTTLVYVQFSKGEPAVQDPGFFTLFVTSDGPYWCDEENGVRGVSPVLDCGHMNRHGNAVSYLFTVGQDARRDKVDAVHELGHLIGGLDHVNDSRSPMDISGATDWDGTFPKVCMPMVDSQCGYDSQCDYNHLLGRLGPKR